MKKIVSFVLLLFAIFAFSQKDVQIKKTWEKDPVFAGEMNGFSNEVSKALEYVVHQNYFVDGKVTLLFKIDEKGKYKIVEAYPENLTNKKAFIDDMNYVFKRFKKKWEPATTNNIPVESFFVYKINFQMMTYDED